MQKSAYCRRCGHPTVPHEVRHERCTSCGRIEWSNPAPAVGVAILRNGQVLLSKRARPPMQGGWDLVGGFVEPGEDAEQTVQREVMEETGLHLRTLKFQGTAAGAYGGRPTFNLLFVGEVDGDPKAQDDSLELRWFELDAVPAIVWPHEAALVASLQG